MVDGGGGVMRFDVTRQELGTMLAALRYWQNFLGLWNAGTEDAALLSIATNDGQHDALTYNEIDALYKRANVEYGHTMTRVRVKNDSYSKLHPRFVGQEGIVVSVVDGTEGHDTYMGSTIVRFDDESLGMIRLYDEQMEELCGSD